MDRPDLARTIEARLAEDPDLAATLVKAPRETITPKRPASERGLGAIETLVTVGAVAEDKLELHETIGEGGMGIVHLATQVTLGRHVAVKTIRPGVTDIEAVVRILREAWIAGTLDHPNVVPIHDLGINSAGAPVIVMKRIEGSAWSELMHDPAEIARRFGASDPLEWNLGVLKSVCNAVHFAHSKGILHRDLKPENVMVGAFGEVYLVDWGIAVSLKDDPSGRLPQASEATELAGTPCYIAPEMLLGTPSLLSPRTDVYLLGAILYDIFTGRAPHEASTIEAMVSSALISEPDFPANYPAEARTITTKAMRREPPERYESAEALRLAIDDYQRHRGSRKLAHDARQSLERLLRILQEEPASEERTLAVFNLLGECRFGYKSALSAWPDNEAARKGLDRALLAVIDHELSEGDPTAAAALLREVAAPPPEVASRVETAIRARAQKDAELRKLEADLDPTVGTRTRTFAGALLGVLWTLTPLCGLWAERSGIPLSHAPMIVISIGFLLLGGVLFLWARDSLTKTQINRRVSASMAVYLVGQIVLGVSAWQVGITPEQTLLVYMFAWALTEGLLAVWIERWFAASAVVTAISIVLATQLRSWIYPLMAIDNAVLTAVVLLAWFPRQWWVVGNDFIRERRAELRRRAKTFLVEAGKGARTNPPGETKDDE